jgi:hypothetical protein
MTELTPTCFGMNMPSSGSACAKFYTSYSW